MTIKLYNNSAENNRVDKSGYLSNELVIDNVILKDGTSIIRPSLILNMSIVPYNYLYINDFNRYYFIVNIVSIRNGVWRLDCRVDVLMSYRNQILLTNAFVSRNEYDFNPLIEDELKQLEYEKTVYYEDITTTTGETVDTFGDDGQTPLTDNFLVAVSSILGGYCLINNVYPPNYPKDIKYENRLPTSSSKTCGTSIATEYYVMTNVDAVHLFQKEAIYNDENKRSFIKSAIAYPFKIPKTAYEDYMTTTTHLPWATKIPLGNPGHDTSNWIDMFTQLYYPSSCNVYLKIADFTFELDDVSYLDYEPYTTYELFIPYFNFVTLSLKDILNKRLQVIYMVSIEDGTATFIVYNYTDDRVLYQNTCQLGVNIGITSTNIEQNKRDKTAIATQNILTTISGAILATVGASTGNPALAVAGLGTVGLSIGKGVTEANRIIDKANIAINSGNDGILSSQKCFWRITKVVKLTSYNSAGYKFSFGRPLNEYRLLGFVRGYTEVSKVHLENFTSATADELSEIENDLKSGVILGG